jgi:three-Cys-motif partner protein
VTDGHIRAWGYWSQAKLQILDDYLRAFLRASSTIQTRIYIDAFAGSGTGRDRATGEEFAGSARIALEAAAGEHQFTKLLFFESPEPAAELERALRPLYPQRDFTVYPGDCNTQIPLAGPCRVSWRLGGVSQPTLSVTSR